MDYDTTAPYYKALNDRFSKATEGKSIAPLREMHQLSAVGVGKAIDFDDTKKTIHMAFKVVDDDAWKKVVERVYTGFSQGGSYVKTWQKGDLTYYTADPSEISLVDNPCLAEATYEYVKTGGAVEMCKTNIAPAKVDQGPVDLSKLVHFDRLKAQAKSKMVAKGMYSVQELGRIIESLKWLQTDVLYERDFEGDDSPMPEQLAEILRETVQCFLAMAEEETTELLAALGKGANMTAEEIKALEAKLAKRKALLEKAKTTMKALHDHLGKAVEMCKAVMGADDDDDDAKKTVKTAEELALEKAAADAAELAKKKAADDAAAAAAAAAKGDQVTMTKAEIAQLVKEGVEKAMADQKANLTKGTLIPRPGEQLAKTTDTAKSNDLSDAGLT